MSLIKLKKPHADVHRNHDMYMKFGTITTLLIFIAMFRVNFDIDREVDFNIVEQEIVEIEEIIQTEQIESPPPPPRPPVPVEVPNDAIIDDEILDLGFELDLDGPLDLPPPPPPSDDVEEDEPEIFVVVERMPELIGGLAELQRKIVYPEIARLAGIEGRVMVQFVIDEQGRVHNPVVVRGIGGGCDEAAVEAVKQARFTPGMQRGQPVKVRYTLPITFRLSQAERN
jgi:periplasmic protein TonB